MVVLVPVGRPIISLAPFATSTVFISLLLVLLPSLLPFSAGIALLIVRLLLLFPLARPLVRCLGVLDLLLPNDGLGQPLLWRDARLLLVLLVPLEEPVLREGLPARAAGEGLGRLLGLHLQSEVVTDLSHLRAHLQ